MKFGIMPLTIDRLIQVVQENILKGRGLEGLSSYRFSEIYKLAAEAGYKHCEITLDFFQMFPIPINPILMIQSSFYRLHVQRVSA